MTKVWSSGVEYVSSCATGGHETTFANIVDGIVLTQPFTVTFNEYVPLIDGTADVLVGFCTLDTNPPGPVHA